MRGLRRGGRPRAVHAERHRACGARPGRSRRPRLRVRVQRPPAPDGRRPAASRAGCRHRGDRSVRRRRLVGASRRLALAARTRPSARSPTSGSRAGSPRRSRSARRSRSGPTSTCGPAQRSWPPETLRVVVHHQDLSRVAAMTHGGARAERAGIRDSPRSARICARRWAAASSPRSSSKWGRSRSSGVSPRSRRPGASRALALGAAATAAAAWRWRILAGRLGLALGWGSRWRRTTARSSSTRSCPAAWSATCIGPSRTGAA